MSKSPVWHPFTQHGLEEAIPRVLSARGAWLSCAEGPPLFDAISSWWVITHGHSDPRIAAAIADQAARLDQVIFAGFTHEPAETLARSLVALAPEGLDHVFYSDSGSTAVEVALKMALGTWHNRRIERHRILVMDGSYHGDTIGAMSIGARGVFNRAYAPLLFDVGTIPFPHAGLEQATLDALEAACRAQPAPAAFIVEPLVLGAGGMMMYAPALLAQMAAICRAHDVLLIADEVMTGWGRTGTLFACEQAGISPDILCTAKGLTGGHIPLAATVASAAIFDAHRTRDRADMFYHSSSFTANPIACAAANANIAIWQNEDVIARIERLGGALQAGLDGLADQPYFANPRRTGAIAAIDIVTGGSGNAGYLSDIAPKVRAAAMAEGLLVRPLGQTLYLMPPYCATPAEIEQAFAIITAVVAELG